MELVCPAGNLPALREALRLGADAIYIGFQDQTNARHFGGLNFDERAAREALAEARRQGVKLFVAINTYAQQSEWTRWQQAVDRAADLGADAVIAADISVLDYACHAHPTMARHLSVQGSATNVDALQFYASRVGIRRAVLPRVLSLRQVEQLSLQSPVELEVFGYGSLCIMAEGRCYLSSYLTGESPNTQGVCSPARFVEWKQDGRHLESRLNGVLIDRFEPGEQAGYPTLCKGRFTALGSTYHVLEEPTSLNTLDILPRLFQAGIAAIKLEGRQRSPAYLKQIVPIWRQAIDRVGRNPEAFQVESAWMRTLQELSEGSQTTLGAYARPWQ